MGDTVSTSGYSSIFPGGIPLGTAQSSTLKGGTHHMITVKLFQDFSSLHLVNIAVNLNIQEINNLKESNNNNEY
jgi:rod shape-determining protein MreC